MNLVEQIQVIGYSLVFGFVFTFAYSLINRMFYKYHQRLIRIVIQITIGILFGYSNDKIYFKTDVISF